MTFRNYPVPDDAEEEPWEKDLKEILALERRGFRLRLFGQFLLFLFGAVTGLLVGLNLHR